MDGVFVVQDGSLWSGERGDGADWVQQDYCQGADEGQETLNNDSQQPLTAHTTAHDHLTITYCAISCILIQNLVYQEIFSYRTV